MKNKEALKIAKLLLQEVRLLLLQQRYQQASEIAELGNVLPLTEENKVLETLTYEKLLDYVNHYPERRLTHFQNTIFSLPEAKRCVNVEAELFSDSAR